MHRGAPIVLPGRGRQKMRSALPVTEVLRCQVLLVSTTILSLAMEGGTGRDALERGPGVAARAADVREGALGPASRTDLARAAERQFSRHHARSLASTRVSSSGHSRSRAIRTVFTCWASPSTAKPSTSTGGPMMWAVLDALRETRVTRHQEVAVPVSVSIAEAFDASAPGAERVDGTPLCGA